MALAPDDAFLIPSSTALVMTEHLVYLLDTMIKNLPEFELRMVYRALEHSLRIADDLLFKMSILSTFGMLSPSDCA